MMRRLNDDDGAIAVITAIMIVLLVSFVALAVDLGFWQTSKRQLQSAADAAALAGCRELARGGSSSDVWAAVEDYAQRNFSTPVELSASSVVPPSAGGLSDIGGDYVKVTVRTEAPSFFARVMGHDQGNIAAQSVARIGYLAGGHGPVPWGLSVLRVDTISASMGGQTIDLWDAGSGRWSGAFGAGHAGPVTVRATNDAGYQEEFTDVVTVGALPSAGVFSAIDLSKTTFTSGVDSTCRVEVSLATSLPANATLKATSFGAAKDMVLDSATHRYVAVVPIPATSEAYITQPITVEYRSGKDQQSATSRVLVRRANYILEDVEVSPAFAGPTDAVSIMVRTLEFEYGVRYQLKVEGGAGSTGNFLALDFAQSSLDHSLCGYPDTPVDPGGHGASYYSDCIVGDPDLTVHLNDLVDTHTGNMSGPTRSGIDDRLAGVALMTFSEWEAAGQPDTKQLFLVPITEKVEDLTGKSQLKIVSFATFFMEEAPSGSQESVIGRFVEYTSPGWVVVDDPPGPLAIQAVHLVKDHLDF